MNRFARTKWHLQIQSGNRHFLFHRTLQVHFHLMMTRVVEGEMGKGRGVKMCGQFTIYAVQQVQIKRRGDSSRIIIGRLEDNPRFAQIQANQEVVSSL